MVVLHFPCILCIDSYIFFISNLGVIYRWGCYYSHFSDDDTKTQSGSVLLKIILLINGGTRIQIQTPKGQELGPSYQRSYAPPGAGGDKPRAHLTVVRQTPTQSLKNQFPALHWEHELGLAFTKNRMNYTNKFLVIPESGDYFVYSQVTFRGTTSECGEISQGSRLNKPDSIIVVITKVTDSYPEPTQLLMGTKSVCEIGSNWFQPIYLGAMFFLNEGDKLMVNVSDISLVDYTKEDKTFFGAFLL
ncbi:tumor necrosis factor ligand superfamily member 15 isoform X2 [Tursiops truncatus]|uniref:Tumor necrosis factor ligand superfamily member 15 n=1 Tax=Tursiops truncatus TaxID=9739 RepID=A0A2U4C9B7_TURTR|nr:tumor necrosis factor ligand superfamily member 15 isoform X2 [Tursiops truncatus]